MLPRAILTIAMLIGGLHSEQGFPDKVRLAPGSARMAMGQSLVCTPVHLEFDMKPGIETHLAIVRAAIRIFDEVRADIAEEQPRIRRPAETRAVTQIAVPVFMFVAHHDIVRGAAGEFDGSTPGAESRALLVLRIDGLDIADGAIADGNKRAVNFQPRRLGTRIGLCHAVDDVFSRERGHLDVASRKTDMP